MRLYCLWKSIRHQMFSEETPKHACSVSPESRTPPSPCEAAPVLPCSSSWELVAQRPCFCLCSLHLPCRCFDYLIYLSTDWRAGPMCLKPGWVLELPGRRGGLSKRQIMGPTPELPMVCCGHLLRRYRVLTVAGSWPHTHSGIWFKLCAMEKNLER